MDYNTQRRIAIHEAGHVMAAHHLGIPILKVEISSGDGRTIMKNSILVLDKDIKNQIVINYAGTAAEELFFSDISSPALEYEDSDFAKSISQIKDYLIMTGRLSKSGTEHDAGDMIAKTSDEMYKLSKEILVNERTKLESLSELLLYRGSLSNTDIQDFFLKNEM